MFWFRILKNKLNQVRFGKKTNLTFIGRSFRDDSVFTLERILVLTNSSNFFRFTFFNKSKISHVWLLIFLFSFSFLFYLYGLNYIDFNLNQLLILVSLVSWFSLQSIYYIFPYLMFYNKDLKPVYTHPTTRQVCDPIKSNISFLVGMLFKSNSYMGDSNNPNYGLPTPELQQFKKFSKIQSYNLFTILNENFYQLYKVTSLVNFTKTLNQQSHQFQQTLNVRKILNIKEFFFFKNYQTIQFSSLKLFEGWTRFINSVLRQDVDKGVANLHLIYVDNFFKWNNNYSNSLEYRSGLSTIIWDYLKIKNLYDMRFFFLYNFNSYNFSSTNVHKLSNYPIILKDETPWIGDGVGVYNSFFLNKQGLCNLDNSYYVGVGVDNFFFNQILQQPFLTNLFVINSLGIGSNLPILLPHYCFKNLKLHLMRNHISCYTDYTFTTFKFLQITK